MSILAIIEVVLGLLDGVLQVATKSTVDEKIVQSVELAIAELKKVHGSEVTKAQLESLRTVPRW